MDVSLIVRHPRPDWIRLKRSQRYFLYAVLALLFLSGVAWAYWNYLRSPGDFETSAKSWAMKIHGAAAMAILVVIGMLLSGHVRFAWRARRNRANGSIFLSAFAVLTITGYGLYYAGGESLRAWTSWIHLAVGLALPILLLIHIFLGRRTRPTFQSSMRSRFASRGVEESTRKVPLFRVPTRQLMRAVTALNFRLRIDAGCSIFIVPLWSSPSRIFSYGRYHRIST
jgi:cbb3-type cytochrome oxidase subunit 3